MNTTNSQWMPHDITGVDAAFPATVKHLMPNYEDIPKEFRDWNRHEKWQKLVGDWFYSGIKPARMNHGLAFFDGKRTVFVQTRPLSVRSGEKSEESL